MIGLASAQLKGQDTPVAFVVTLGPTLGAPSNKTQEPQQILSLLNKVSFVSGPEPDSAARERNCDLFVGGRGKTSKESTSTSLKESCLTKTVKNRYYTLRR